MKNQGKRKISIKGALGLLFDAATDAVIGGVAGQGVHTILNPTASGTNPLAMGLGAVVMVVFGVATTDRVVMVDLEEVKEEVKED